MLSQLSTKALTRIIKRRANRCNGLVIQAGTIAYNLNRLAKAKKAKIIQQSRIIKSQAGDIKASNEIRKALYKKQQEDALKISSQEEAIRELTGKVTRIHSDKNLGFTAKNRVIDEQAAEIARLTKLCEEKASENAELTKWHVKMQQELSRAD
jgi:hypothetical protein